MRPIGCTVVALGAAGMAFCIASSTCARAAEGRDLAQSVTHRLVESRDAPTDPLSRDLLFDGTSGKVTSNSPDPSRMNSWLGADTADCAFTSPGIGWPREHAASQCRDEYWWRGFCQCGTSGSVRCAAVYNGLQIVGGSFINAGGGVVNCIAAWDGTSWTSLLEGVNDLVRAVLVYDGKLIVGGEFTQAGGEPANYIVAWDGVSWSQLGEGVSGGGVSALAIYNGDLIAGGRLTEAGGQPAMSIARWDGSSWSALGEGTSNLVTELFVYEDRL
ncbi:MAG: delta-60 repeat domain-containing protein, partial [Candidatus Eisenbacteria sp.]|nr:delta-60 repeat domain-containing protein [Candidatus Eisenbacteria bacterium]